MARHRFVGIAVLIGLIMLSACKEQPIAPVTGGGSAQAPVESVEVLRGLDDPTQLRVLVQGELADGCARVGRSVVTQGGNMFAVILPLERVDLKTCPPGPQPFERVIALETADLSAGHYTVLVNGVAAGFDLSAPVSAGQGATPEAEPTRVAPVQITAEPTVTAEPTATEPAAAVTPETPAVTPTAEPQPTEPGSSGPTACINKAAFFDDVTVPDGTAFNPGESFTKTWRVKNVGDCTWNGYAVVFVDGEPLGSKDRVQIQQAVGPGEVADISVPMVAPTRPGGYTSEWKFSTADGTIFGLGAAGNATLWAKIGVRTQIAAPQPESGQGPLISCSYANNEGNEENILAAINRARDERGLKPLKLDPRLTAAARGHSQDMACNDFVEHYGSDGSTYYGRIQAAGVRYRTASENIYAGNPTYGGTPEVAFDWWMNSQIHRDAILNPRFGLVGIGYTLYEGSTYGGYFTVKFVEP